MDIIITANHPLFRDGIKMHLEKSGLFNRIYESHNGFDLMKKTRKHHPDVILLDSGLLDIDGFVLAQVLFSKYPEVKVFVLSGSSDKKYAAELINKGIHGFCPKDISGEELVSALTMLCEKGYYYQEKEINNILALNRRGNSNGNNATITLTDRDRQILQLIGEEMKTQEIAQMLDISVNRVEQIRHTLLEKTESKNVVGLIRYAFRNKIVRI